MPNKEGKIFDSEPIQGVECYGLAFWLPRSRAIVSEVRPLYPIGSGGNDQFVCFGLGP